jgi:hypothetical protein
MFPSYDQCTTAKEAIDYNVHDEAPQDRLALAARCLCEA